MANIEAGWGATEHANRLADIADAKAGKVPLEAAQANARRRQREAGLSHAQAAALVSEHCRALRYAATAKNDLPEHADASTKGGQP